MFITLYILATFFFFAIDMLWLGVVARSFYQAQIGSLLKDDVNWTAAFLFYGIFLVGVVVFVLMPAVDKKSLMHAVMYGAFFGVVTYATYDLTNLATLKSWTLTVTVVDIVWGGVLSALVAGLTYSVYIKFFS